MWFIIIVNYFNLWFILLDVGKVLIMFKWDLVFLIFIFNDDNSLIIFWIFLGCFIIIILFGLFLILFYFIWYIFIILFIKFLIYF